MYEFDENDDELWGLWDGQCQACDSWSRVNDQMLCDTCTGMLERDLVRQRDWDYSSMAFGLSPEAREELRRQVITQFGASFELIVPPEEEARKSRRSRRGKERRSKR